MAIEKVNLLTGNEDKLRVAQHVFDRYNIDIEAVDLDIPEIQASTSAEIARHQVQKAFEQLHLPVIREDHSLYIDAINFPGPFMAYANKAIAVDNLLRMVDALPSRDAHFEIAAAYTDNTGNPFVTSFDVPVEIAEEARGDERRGWDTVLRFPGGSETFAEMTDNHDEVWDTNYHRIAKYIVARTVRR